MLDVDDDAGVDEHDDEVDVELGEDVGPALQGAQLPQRLAPRHEAQPHRCCPVRRDPALRTRTAPRQRTIHHAAVTKPMICDQK